MLVSPIDFSLKAQVLLLGHHPSSYSGEQRKTEARTRGRGPERKTWVSKMPFLSPVTGKF